MGAFASILTSTTSLGVSNVGSGGNVVPCTTSTTSSSSVKLATSSSSIAKVTSTPTSSSVVASATPASFWIKSSCDNSCLGHFDADDQIYSNLYTSSNSTFDTFAIKNSVLYDTTTSTLCVASEAGGTETRVQCSNDPDYINGVAVANIWAISNGLLTYDGTSTFYGCGVVDLADNYEPDGLTYSILSGSSGCQACTFSVVYDVNQCNSQAAASSISTNYLAPLPTATSSSTLSTSTKCTTTPKATTTKCTTTSTSTSAKTTTSCITNNNKNNNHW